MKLPNLKPRERRLAILTGLVVFVLGNYLLVAPWVGRVRERAAGLRKQRLEKAYRDETIQKADAWRKELAQLNQSREGSSPHVESQEAWMKHFEALAGKGGVQLVDRRSNRRDEAKGGNVLRVECSLQGNFESVVRFLIELHNDSSHPQIESFQLAPLKAGEDRLRGQMGLAVGLKAASR